MIIRNGFKIDVSRIEKGESYKIIKPTEEEKYKLSEVLEVPIGEFETKFRPLEGSGIEKNSSEHIAKVNFHIPYKESSFSYKIKPVSLILKDNQYYLITNRDVKSFDMTLRKIENSIEPDNIEGIIESIVGYYIRISKEIEMKSEKMIEIIKKNTKEADLKSVFEVQSSLSYLDFAIDGLYTLIEGGITEKIIVENDKIKMSKVKIRNLEKTVDIYMNILQSALDYIENNVNNRLNDIMKFLTGVTVALSIPMIIAGFWGMNVRIPKSEAYWDFTILVFMSIVLTIATIVLLFRKKEQ